MGIWGRNMDDEERTATQMADDLYILSRHKNSLVNITSLPLKITITRSSKDLVIDQKVNFQENWEELPVPQRASLNFNKLEVHIKKKAFIQVDRKRELEAGKLSQMKSRVPNAFS